jgi:YHS domain-containing protein
VLEETKKASEHEVPPNAQYYFSEEEKKEFRENPEHHLAYRRKLEEGLSAGFDMFTQGSDLSKMVEDIFRAEMLRRIGPGHEDLKERLIPSWPPGCTFSPI